MAAGRLAETPVDWLSAVVPDAATLHFDEETIDTAGPLDGRELVIIAHDLHRHEWERTAVGAFLERALTRYSSRWASATGDLQAPRGTSQPTEPPG